MKKIYLICLFSLTSAGLFAQQVNFTVKRDNPDFIPFWNLNLSYLDIDVPFSTVDAIALNGGIWGNFEPVNGLGVDYRFRRSYLSMGSLGYDDHTHFSNFEIGAYWKFGGGTKTRETKVVLDADQYDDYINNERVYTATFITIPAKNRRDYLLRGGFYHLASPINTEDIQDQGGNPLFTEDIGRASLNGLYAGIAMRSITNVFVETDTYGYQFNSLARLLYLDALFVGTSINDPWAAAANVSDAAKDDIGSLPLGFRIGYSGFQIEKKQWTDKKFGMSYNFEAGYRPYIGWYVSGGLGLTLVKWNKEG